MSCNNTEFINKIKRIYKQTVTKVKSIVHTKNISKQLPPSNATGILTKIEEDLPPAESLPPSSVEKLSGVIIYIDQVQGYGFIKPDNGTEDLFFNYLALPRPSLNAVIDQKVKYDVIDSRKGPRAQNIEYIN